MTAPKYFVDLDDVLHQALIKSNEISIMGKSAELPEKLYVEAMKMTAELTIWMDAKLSGISSTG